MGGFHLLAVVNTVAAIRTPGSKYSSAPPFSSLGFVPESGIAGSYGNSIFNVFGNHHTGFLRVHFEVILVRCYRNGI